MKWLERGRGPVPMRFDRLVEGTVDDGALRDDLHRLVLLKSQARERENVSPSPGMVNFVRRELARLEAEPPVCPRGERLRPGELDELFRAVLRENERMPTGD